MYNVSFGQFFKIMSKTEAGGQEVERKLETKAREKYSTGEFLHFAPKPSEVWVRNEPVDSEYPDERILATGYDTKELKSSIEASAVDLENTEMKTRRRIISHEIFNKIFTGDIIKIYVENNGDVKIKSQDVQKAIEV